MILPAIRATGGTFCWHLEGVLRHVLQLRARCVALLDLRRFGRNRAVSEKESIAERSHPIGSNWRFICFSFRFGDEFLIHLHIYESTYTSIHRYTNQKNWMRNQKMKHCSCQTHRCWSGTQPQQRSRKHRCHDQATPLTPDFLGKRSSLDMYNLSPNKGARQVGGWWWSPWEMRRWTRTNDQLLIIGLATLRNMVN